MQDPSDLVPIKAEVHGVQIGRGNQVESVERNLRQMGSPAIPGVA